jgi:hypothetical protein
MQIVRICRWDLAYRSRPRLCQCLAKCIGIICQSICGWSRIRFSVDYTTPMRSKSREREDKVMDAHHTDSRVGHHRERRRAR